VCEGLASPDYVYTSKSDHDRMLEVQDSVSHRMDASGNISELFNS